MYSRTAAELFWERSVDPDGFVRAYEIRRDGELLRTDDGLSFFTDKLERGVTSEFTVTAVDFDGLRCSAASVSITTGQAPSSGTDRPLPPAILCSDIYSRSSAELFWDRSRTPGLRYEVLRNGQVVRTTDGTSAYLSGLSGASGQTFDVVAINANGQRSGAATVTLGGSNNANPNPPAAPSNVRAERYSSSAGEVFWDRVTGQILTYEISLDGEVVATRNGTSYFASGRNMIDGTRVEVVAIGPDGERSAPVSTTIGEGTSAPARRHRWRYGSRSP